MTIALTHFAGRAGDHNDRAMVGSRLLAAVLESRFERPCTIVGSPRPALANDWRTELLAAHPELLEMRARYDELLAVGTRPVTALSRCAVALATLPAVARYRPDAMVVWFDAHADINTPASTTTQYLGGLALSAPLGLWHSGLGANLRPDRVILVGTRDIDEPEQALIDQGDIRLVAPGADLPGRLRRAVAGRPVYVHIDCDVLEPGIVPTDYHVPAGLTLSDLHDTANVLAESEIVGIEIGELEAESDDGEDLVAALLDALGPILKKVDDPSS